MGICFFFLKKSYKSLIFSEQKCYDHKLIGEMAERSKAAVLKTVEGLNPPRVRIPVSPPSFEGIKSVNLRIRRVCLK